MNVVTRTPLRVSLFGGGSDYPAWYTRRPGAVLGFAIDKHIYISALRLTSFIHYRFRLAYSRVETIEGIGDIQHPVVREVLRHYGWDQPLDVSVQADLPASSGLGSSSAFTVGFINALSALNAVPRTRRELAELAIHAEQELLHESVGVQDQLHATFGGINRFNFDRSGFSIEPLAISGADLQRMAEWMLLVHTGQQRRASEVACHQVASIASEQVDPAMGRIVALVDDAQRLLARGGGDAMLPGLAEMLDEAWRLKRGIAGEISSPAIDGLYQQCREAGALGGKLCGAGGGGFLLMVVPPSERDRFHAAIPRRRCIGFGIDMLGSTVLRG